MTSAEQDLGKSRHGVPDVVMKQIDKYIDSLAPQIQPRIAQEIDTFQNQTIDGLERQIIAAFRNLFEKSASSQRTTTTTTPDGGGGGGPAPSSSRSIDERPPDAYGGLALPFANEIASVARSFREVTDNADDDILQIFNLTESNQQQQQQAQSRGLDAGSAFAQGARGFLSAALDAVSDAASQGTASGPARFGGILDLISDTVKDASRDPEGKARMLSPEVKEKVGGLLRKQHAPLADKFTEIALSHLKRWLRGNTSSRDLGDGLKGEISSLVSGFAGMLGKGSKKEGSGQNERGAPGGDGDGGSGGFSGVISDKLSVGLARVHREVRIEFRNNLGQIEKQLFEALPDEIQGPLEKVLGGNPFDPSLEASGGPGATTSRGFGDDLKAKLVDTLRRLVRKVQQALQTAITSTVAGGHRKLEVATWGFVQKAVEERVQKYLPKVRISVPDDIGNEGVSVGQPQSLPGIVQGGQPSQGGWQAPGDGGSGQLPPPHQPYGQGQGQPLSPPPPQQQQHQQQQPYLNQSQPGFQTSPGPQGSAGFPMPQINHYTDTPAYSQPPQGAPYRDGGIVPTQKFRSANAPTGRRQEQQGGVVDDWDADSDGETAQRRQDPFQAGRDEWNRANNQPRPAMPLMNDSGRTLPASAYGSGLSGTSGGHPPQPATGFPQPYGGSGGGSAGGSNGTAPAPPRILQRPRDLPPGASMGGPSSGSNTPTERKTVEQRQEEYRIARARIFGDEAR